MSSLSLEASARRFGHGAWAERRLFEMLGRWSGDTCDPAVRPVLAANAAHHGWRAGILADRLPRARGLDVDGWIAPPGEAAAEAFAMLDRPGPDETTARLVGIYRVVVPLLVESYRNHLDLMTELADRPGIRWLGLVLQDEIDDLRRGADLLAGRDETAAAVVAHRDQLAGLLAGGWISSDVRANGAVHHASGDEQASTTLPPTDRNSA
jgi:hypothetical protein